MPGLSAPSAPPSRRASQLLLWGGDRGRSAFCFRRCGSPAAYGRLQHQGQLRRATPPGQCCKQLSSCARPVGGVCVLRQASRSDFGTLCVAVRETTSRTARLGAAQGQNGLPAADPLDACCEQGLRGDCCVCVGGRLYSTWARVKPSGTRWPSEETNCLPRFRVFSSRKRSPH